MSAATAQIAFRYRTHDSATGVTRTTAQLTQIKKSAPKREGGQVRSSLFET
jgi:hypothetical protein